MLSKIRNILLLTIVGAIAFYLLLFAVALPGVTPWVVKTHVAKFIKHPISVRKVSFNPVFLHLTVFGLEITDARMNKLLGFERLSVDVSFRSLLKKIYHIESLQLQGLFVHATLLENGHIDLMDVIPTLPTTNPPVKQEKTTSLPTIIIDSFLLQDGHIEFSDQLVTPNFKTTFSEIELSVHGFSTKSDSQVEINSKGLWDDFGAISASGKLKPFAKMIDMDFVLNMDHYGLTGMNPYVGKYTGRILRDGKLDFRAVYNINDNKLKATHKILIQRFGFGEKVESQDALNLPFGLAVALLQDSSGRIDISLPVEGDITDPKFDYTHLIWQTTRNFFMKLITKPFSVLGSLIPSLDSGTDLLGSIQFVPGKTDLLPEEQKKIGILSQVLKDRPRLLLEINGSYDLTHDWKAIKSEQFLNEYTELKNETSRSEYWVLQTMYQRHFGIRQLWKLTRPFKIKGGYDYEKLNVEIRRQLKEDALPDKMALNVLARARAKVVYDAILRERVDPRRVRIGIVQEVQASLEHIPLELKLTVFDQPTGEEEEPLDIFETNTIAGEDR